MMQTNTIFHSAEDLQKAIELRMWVDSMPTWFKGLGDHGHTDIEEEIANHLPDVNYIFEEEYDDISQTGADGVYKFDCYKNEECVCTLRVVAQSE